MILVDGARPEYLVEHAIPSKPSVVHDNMDLPVAKLGGLLHKLGDVLVVEQITCYCDCAAAGLVDLLCDLARLCCNDLLVQVISIGSTRLTTVDITNNDLRALIREDPRGLRANALPRTSNDGDLTGQQTLGVVEVAGDLIYALRVGHCVSDFT